VDGLLGSASGRSIDLNGSPQFPLRARCKEYRYNIVRRLAPVCLSRAVLPLSEAADDGELAVSGRRTGISRCRDQQLRSSTMILRSFGNELGATKSTLSFVTAHSVADATSLWPSGARRS
jgi:hypothetical protein